MSAARDELARLICDTLEPYEGEPPYDVGLADAILAAGYVNPATLTPHAAVNLASKLLQFATKQPPRIWQPRYCAGCMKEMGESAGQVGESAVISAAATPIRAPRKGGE